MLELPQISQEDKQKLAAPITIDEVSLAVKALSNQKSPGLDSILIDFYKMFWDKIKQPVFEMLEGVIQDRQFHLTAQQGVLSLLEKVDKNPLFLRNWHPLSLLTADNKIFSKLLANRLEQVMANLVHFSQTGFMKGRYMAKNLLKITQIMHYCQVKNIRAVLVSFDFLKAFNTVEWETLFITLQKFGFPAEYIEMVCIL